MLIINLAHTLINLEYFNSNVFCLLVSKSTLAFNNQHKMFGQEYFRYKQKIEGNTILYPQPLLRM